MLQDEKNLISPLTGGKMTLHWEWRDMTFRKETYRVMFPYYLCEDTKEQFTTTESDGIWLHQIHNQYCSKYGIPYTDEIIAVRERYGLSASKMSLILGFGENQWRRYEQEEIPSLSNGKMIRSIMNPRVFLDLVEGSKSILTEKEYLKIKNKVCDEIKQSEDYLIEAYAAHRIFKTARSEWNGFAPLSLNRLKNILLYILNYCGETYCTKMNKLLFYIDFLAYKETGIALTGLSYRAMEFGPVPEHWDRVFCQFDEIIQEQKNIKNHDCYVLKALVAADATVLNNGEQNIIKKVCDKFKGLSSADISKLSHKETIWSDSFKNQERISFNSAFTMKAL